MPLHAWSVANPALELELGDIKRRDPLPLELLEALDSRYGQLQNSGFVDAYDHQRTAQVQQHAYQKALALHSELEAKADGMLNRCRVRYAIARYLRETVIPFVTRRDGWNPAIDYLLLAQKLEDARPCAVWGVDPMDESLKVQWANRAGLVKLCPDDAREEQQRQCAIYGERLDLHDDLGHMLRSAVFTLPNLPQWHLAAGIDAIFNRFRDEILYARVDGKRAKNLKDPKRRFPDIIGAWACLEAPLSGEYRRDRLSSWNVHLNVMLVFRRAGELVHARQVNGQTVPDYEPIREAWGANVRFRTLPQGDKDAIRAAIRELIKYPLQAVSLKSAEHRTRRRGRDGRELEPAPPMIEWPPEFFDEWWRAHHRLRRTRSWGCLFSARFELEGGDVVEIPPPGRPNPDHFDWLGAIKLSPSRCVVTRPMWDSRELDERQMRADRRAALTLIQGNIFSAAKSHGGLKSGSDPPGEAGELKASELTGAN